MGQLYDQKLKEIPDSKLTARYFDPVTDKEVFQYYGELKDKAYNYCAALQNKVTQVTVDDVTINAVGFLSKNQFEMACFEVATQLGGYTAVPL